ncbi:MAG TPA: transglycosylase SLT domain-containing protein [Burkholderiaceae bacterium]|nr:transglycosylase SLT domain-containing protein [Burkholderiaceae bacterium]
MTIRPWAQRARAAAAQPAGFARRLGRASAASVSVFLRDAGRGLLEVSHNTLALLGLALAAVAIFAAGRADIRQDAETWALGWLQARQEARAEPLDPSELLALSLSEPDAIARATASDPKELSRQQAAVANWLARRYRVAPEPVSRLVQEAWSVGQKAGLDPTLILAIMAVESSFNPFAQSSVGAQGLMQVMTKVHNDKYEAFGGNHAAFDPVTNLRVGVQVLKECIARAGSLEAGLRFYVGAANLADDSGYAQRVLGEQNALRLVASGKRVSERLILTVTPAAPRPETRAADTPPAKPSEAPHPEQIALLR